MPGTRRHLLWTPVVFVSPASFPLSSRGKGIPWPLGEIVSIFPSSHSACSSVPPSAQEWRLRPQPEEVQPAGSRDWVRGGCRTLVSFPSYQLGSAKRGTGAPGCRQLSCFLWRARVHKWEKKRGVGVGEGEHWVFKYSSGSMIWTGSPSYMSQ